MRPLYLDGVTALNVSMDGPALRVSGPSSADRRYPLARISRVVVSGQVSWTTDALLTCADEGIVVCFLNADGDVRGRWIGRRSERSAFVQRWHDFVDRPDWKERYAQWRVATRRRAIRLCAMCMGWSPKHDPRSLSRSILDATRPCADNQEMRTIKRRLHGLAQSRALEELAKIGLQANDVVLLNIVPDLVAAIQWGLHPDLTRWLLDRQRRREPKQPSDPYGAVCFFERHRGTCDFALRDTLLRLNQYLRGLQ